MAHRESRRSTSSAIATLIDRMLANDLLPGARPSASSPRPRVWAGRRTEELTELLDTPDLEAGASWFEEHGKADYYHTKQAVCAYVARQAFPLLQQGIRINAICPGPTDTPLAQANKDTWLAFGADYREEVGTAPRPRSSRRTPSSSSAAMRRRPSTGSR